MSGISLGRSTILLLLCRVVGYVFALVNSVILARALGAERLGAYAYAIGVAALFGLLPNLGINPVVTRTVAMQPHTAAAMLQAALRAQGLFAGAVLMLIIGFAMVLPGQPVPLLFVALAASQLIIGTLSWPYLAILGGFTRFDRVAGVELAAGFVGTASLLIAVMFDGGVVGVLEAQVLAAAIAVI